MAEPRGRKPREPGSLPARSDAVVRARLLATIALAALGAPAEAGDPPRPARQSPRCIVTGRVVDGWDSGVPAVKVAWVGNAPEGDRSTATPVLTDDTGHFRLVVDGPADEDARGLIHATRGDDSAALEPLAIGIWERDTDVGPLELRPARPLWIDARRDGAPAPDAQVWVWSGRHRGDGPAFLGAARTGPTGRAEFAPLRGGYLRICVHGADGSVEHTGTDVEPGSAPSRVRVTLGPSRSADVLVTTDDSPARPIAGAHVFRKVGVRLGIDVATSVAVEVPDRIPPTGADGRTRVNGLPSDWGSLEVRVPGRPRAGVLLKPGETTATIVVPEPHRIAVEDEEQPRPSDGTRLVVRGWRMQGDLEGSMENGALVVPVKEGLAIAPDGSMARLEKGKPAAFVRPRSLVVRVVEADGRGIGGVGVMLCSSPRLPGPWQAPVRTDGEGRVRFDGLAPVKHFIELAREPGDPYGHRVDEVSLGPEDSVREVFLGAECTLQGKVTVDGKPAIPEWFRWTIPNAIVVDAAVDRAGGTVRIRARHAPGMSPASPIAFSGRGVRPWETPFAWPARGSATEIEVPLFTSPEVILDIRADLDSDVRVDVERWDVNEWNFKPWEWAMWQSAAGPYQAGRIATHFPEGRYRLRDRVTSLVSNTFDVPERGGLVQATLDLTGLVTVRGRVECPDPEDAKNVELVVDGEGIDTEWACHPGGKTHGIDYDGKSFALRLPAGKSFTISPWHWKHRPAREGGQVTVVGPREDVVLKMGPGATLVAKLTDADGRPLSAEELQKAWITAIPTAHPFWRDEIGTMNRTMGEPGKVSVSGLPFGTLDVWIQVDGFAARRLERTVVSSDTTDLGEVRLSRGSTVRLRRVGKEGTESPVGRDIDGWAFATFGPRQIRDLRHVHDEFTGLCAGRWRVEVWPSGTEFSLERTKHAVEVDLDGEHDLTLDVDANGWLVPFPK